MTDAYHKENEAMTREEALRALLEKVEAGTATRIEIEDTCIPVWPDGERQIRHIDAAAAYNGSLDAAKALHDAVLPGWTWEMGSFCMSATVYAPDYPGYDFEAPLFSGESKDPARA